MPKMSSESVKIKLNSQRFKSNEFVKNEEEEGVVGEYFYYVRPFIPFWSVQSLSFDKINSLKAVPNQREATHPRYVLQKLARTWLLDSPNDINWFDNHIIYEELKKDLIARLESKFLSPDLSVKKLSGISDFHRHRALILDCWMLYLHKNFKKIDHQLKLSSFPFWNSSNEFKFNLYVEVVRTLESEPLKEFNENGNRLWLKVDDLKNDLYQQHYRPTVYNTDLKILTTEQYIPLYLKTDPFQRISDDLQHIKYFQKESIIVRRHEVEKKPRFSKNVESKQKLDEDQTKTDLASNKEAEAAKNFELENEVSKNLDKFTMEIKELKCTIQEKDDLLLKAKTELEEKKKLELELEKMRIEMQTIIQQKQEISEQLKFNTEANKKELEKNTATVNELSRVNGKLSTQIQEYEKLYCGDASSKPLVFSGSEKEDYNRFDQYIKSITSMPQGIKIKVKALKKLITMIRKYKANSEQLIRKYNEEINKPVLDRNWNRELRNELFYRLAHNQHIIDTKKATIQNILDQKYEEKFFDVATKIVRYCNQFTEDDFKEQSELVCPDDVLNLDILSYLEKKFPTREQPYPEIMSDEQNKEFRKLVEIIFDENGKDTGNFHDFSI